jgi:hypothetical protein
MFRSRIMASLGTALSFLLLNLGVIVVSAFVVTVPIALNGAFVAIEKWHQEREDRVLREFFVALRSSAPLRTTLVVGVPIVAVAVGVEEVRYFATGGRVMARICFGLGVSALVITVTALGYVFILAVRAPTATAAEIWSAAIRSAIRNILVTGPVFLVEVGIATLAAVVDPPLCVLGLPVLLLYTMHRTADLGLRRLERDRSP